AHGFRYYFTPLPGYFSPFPHGTGPLSVTREYLGLAGGPARFTRDSSGPVLLGYRSQCVSPFTPTGVPPSVPDLSMSFGFDDSITGQSGRTDEERPHYPVYATSAEYHAYTVWPLPLSLATTHGITCCFLFLWVLRCFTSPRSLRHPMCSGDGDGT